MCKILTITGIKRKDQKKAARIMWSASKHMPKDDPHGWGYAAVGPRGDVFTEKWLNPKDALIARDKLSGAVQKFISALDTAVEQTVGYDTQGKFDNTSTIMMHSRWATCEVSIDNTHPFVVGDTALIHNGVVYKSAGLRYQQSTCDSELILNGYIDANVASDPANIKLLADKLYGSYAVTVLSKDKDGRPILDVFRNDGSNLVVGWIETMNAAVFCTTPSLLTSIMKDANLRFRIIGTITSGHLIRIDAQTGKTISVTPFAPNDRKWKDDDNGYKSDYRPYTYKTPSELMAEQILAERDAERDYSEDRPELNAEDELDADYYILLARETYGEVETEGWTREELISLGKQLDKQDNDVEESEKVDDVIKAEVLETPTVGPMSDHEFQAEVNERFLRLVGKK